MFAANQKLIGWMASGWLTAGWLGLVTITDCHVTCVIMFQALKKFWKKNILEDSFRRVCLASIC